MKIYLISMTVLVLLLQVVVPAQQTGNTAEDSLENTELKNTTSIGGYGNAVYKNNLSSKTATVNMERFVLFVGHNFGYISFFSELEVEDAKVEGGENGGEIALEQAYLKFNLDQNHYLTAGLFLPRIGILNIDHLPNAFNGNERTQVETYIIPSTWRELGIGFYGSLDNYPLNYSFAIVNGLSSSNFTHGSGIRGGRFEGREASANNLAITSAIQFYLNNFRIQASAYYGGTVGIESKEEDRLQLKSGIFGTPVAIGEVDVQYKSEAYSFKALGAIVSITDASNINGAYNNNTPQMEYGGYLEFGYDILYSKRQEKQLIAFMRYEKLDMNAKIPENGIIDGALDQQHLIAGLSYLPIKNVVIKADVRFQHTGEQNSALVTDPAEKYERDKTFLNLGIGFSF